MLPLNIQIDRTERLLRRLEEDAPLMAVRISQLAPEHQRAAKAHVAELAAKARAELQKLIDEISMWDSNDPTPQAAD
ncbi:MAG TPA: hypothetical protein VH437_06130 [Terriglobales bacterium]|jgi:hypothetical protein